jgi:hypothetical protein
MKGQDIVIKDVSGTPVVVKYWSACRAGVFVHSKEEFDKRMQGEKHLEPVGVPATDVFVYDDNARLEIAALAKGRVVNWAILTPYRDDRMQA